MRRDNPCFWDQLIEAADHAVALVDGVNIDDLAIDRIRQDALLHNFTVPGEALGQRCCTRGGRLKHAADQFDAGRRVRPAAAGVALVVVLSW